MMVLVSDCSVMAVGESKGLFWFVYLVCLFVKLMFQSLDWY